MIDFLFDNAWFVIFSFLIIDLAVFISTRIRKKNQPVNSNHKTNKSSEFLPDSENLNQNDISVTPKVKDNKEDLEKTRLLDINEINQVNNLEPEFYEGSKQLPKLKR